jgi:transposase-like protein
MPKELRHHCNQCYTHFSVTVRTVFHQTHLPLQKWFLAIFLILDAQENVTVRQLAKDLQINKNTAWSLVDRVDRAMAESEQRDLLQNLLRMDEVCFQDEPSGCGEEDRVLPALVMSREK